MEGDREQGGYNGRGVREKDVGWGREREGGRETKGGRERFKEGDRGGIVRERERSGEKRGKGIEGERASEKVMMLETKGDIGWEVRPIELVKGRYR